MSEVSELTPHEANYNLIAAAIATSASGTSPCYVVMQVLSVTEGNMHIRSVSGKIDVGVARGATLRVDAESMSGSVQSDIPLEDGPGGAREDPRITLTLRSVSGDVLITRGVEAFVR